jgi:hypothetical protein
LSYAALKGTAGSRFVSTAGALNEKQPGLLLSAMKDLPAGGSVVLAVDNDAGGDRLAAQIRSIHAGDGAIGCVLVEDRPPVRGQDWNDVLQATMRDGHAARLNKGHQRTPIKSRER